jgi:hypothetical protein
MNFPKNGPITSYSLKKWGIYMLSIYIIIILVLFIIGSKRKLIINIIKSIFPASISERFTHMFLSFSDGLKILNGNRHLSEIILHSFLLWIVNAFSIYLIFKSFNLHLPILAPLFLLIIISFVVLLPSSPGYIGTYHAGCVYGLSLFKIPKENALGISIILHGISFFPIIILGLIFLWIENISLKDISKGL